MRPATGPRPSTDLAGQALLASGDLAAIGVVFLAGMFASFAAGATAQALTLGRINDVLVLVSYLLAMPGVIAIHILLRRRAPLRSAVVAAIGTAALGAIVVLQALLVAGIVSFEAQVGLVSAALLVLGVWFVVSGWMGRSDDVLRGGPWIGVLAATYVGYPIWAFWMGRRLRQRSGEPANRGSVIIDEGASHV